MANKESNIDLSRAKTLNPITRQGDMLVLAPSTSEGTTRNSEHYFTIPVDAVRELLASDQGDAPRSSASGGGGTWTANS